MDGQPYRDPHYSVDVDQIDRYSDILIVAILFAIVKSIVEIRTNIDVSN